MRFAFSAASAMASLGNGQSVIGRTKADLQTPRPRSKLDGVLHEARRVAEADHDEIGVIEIARLHHRGDRRFEVGDAVERTLLMPSVAALLVARLAELVAAARTEKEGVNPRRAPPRPVDRSARKVRQIRFVDILEIDGFDGVREHVVGLHQDGRGVLVGGIEGEAGQVVGFLDGVGARRRCSGTRHARRRASRCGIRSARATCARTRRGSARRTSPTSPPASSSCRWRWSSTSPALRWRRRPTPC